MGEIGINCSFSEMAKVGDLIHHPRNPNAHGAGQLEFLKKILSHQGWRAPLVISKLSGHVVCGNGRLMAAKALGLDEVPIDRQEFKNEADEIAHMLADNKIAELAEMNFESVAGLLAELETTEIDLDLTGFRDFEREPLMEAEWSPPKLDGLDGENDSPYGKAIKMTTDQRAVFDKAAQKLRVSEDDPATTDGRIVELIAADYMAGE